MDSIGLEADDVSGCSSSASSEDVGPDDIVLIMLCLALRHKKTGGTDTHSTS